MAFSCGKRQTKDNPSSRSKASSNGKARPSARGFQTVWRVTLIGLVVLGRMPSTLTPIKHAFSGNKWEVPAQIFARPLEISKGEEITPQEVIDELNLLGYRKVTFADSSGEYSYQNKVLTVQRRAFQFPEGAEPLRHLVITWEGARIGEIYDKSQGRPYGSAKLEPWL